MVKGKTIRIDENVHRILVRVKEEMRSEDIGQLYPFGRGQKDGPEVG